MVFQSTERYLVERVLGEGGHGVVYEALDTETGLKVALKTLRTLSPETLFEFKKEFRSIQNLNHPNLVELYDLGTAHGTWFFTMQLVEGHSVLEYVRPSSLMLSAHETTGRLDHVANLSLPSVPEPETLQRQTPIPSLRSIGGTLDLLRLRACVAQIAHGLMALHETGKVHRDIKPNNMLVTPQGRVVILDFGLTAEVSETSMPRSDTEISGTVAYMAPEQAAASSVGPAADWYALGVVLYECLCGRLPFSGNPMQVLVDKQRFDPPDPRQFSPDLPQSLAELALSLLAINPNQRPKGLEVVERLQATTAIDTVWASSAGTNAFVGREHELEVLGRAFSQLHHGPQAVCISSESGLGKSTLLRALIQKLERRMPQPLILEGACYQRESVPYKGIDGALDTLATGLSREDQAWLRTVLPPEAGLLSQFFPVLSRVSALAEARREPQGPSADASDLRQRLFVALRELLRKVSLKRPVVLALDDIQWAGEDTWALLREVFRANDGPTVLLVTTVRLEPNSDIEERQRHLHSELRGVDAAWLRLARLSTTESHALAQQLLKRVGASEHLAEQMVLESSGNPLLLDALARGGVSSGERNLEALLLSRFRSLEPPAQRILELASMSNAPIVLQAVSRAAEIDFGVFSRIVATLKVLRLIRTSGSRALDTLQPFHDRLRVVVAGSLTAERQRHLQQRLALALESTTVPDSEALAWHWAQAGDDTRAAQHAQRAGTQAMERLAFERAAHFFRQAVALNPTSRQLCTRLGEALVGAGRGAEAAEAFAAAAANANSLEALELTRRAAHEFLRSGHFDRGLRGLGEVLAVSGERLNASRFVIVLLLLFDRAILFFRGMRFRERLPSAVSASALLRVDATWSVSEALSTIDVLGGAGMQVRNLRLALSAGEPMRIARALAIEAGVVASEGGARKYSQAREIWNKAEALARHSKDRGTIVLVQTVDGIVEFLGGRLATSRERLREAIKTLESENLGTRFELISGQLFLIVAHVYLGQLREFMTLVPKLLEEGQRRGDLLALTSFRVNHCNLYWLAQDDTIAARANILAATQQWSPKGYQTLHYYALLARAQLALYEGQGAKALSLVMADWPLLKKNFLLRAQMLRAEATHLRGRCAWAAGDETEARRCEQALEREDNAVAKGLAAGLRACFALHGAQDEAALDAAQNVLNASGLGLLEHAVRYARGVAGEAQWFQEQGVKRPEAFVRVLLPLRS